MLSNWQLLPTFSTAAGEAPSPQASAFDTRRTHDRSQQPRTSTHTDKNQNVASTRWWDAFTALP